MTFQGAKIKERGLTCGVVIVETNVIGDEVEADRMITAFQNQVFHQIAVVLMAQDRQGTPTYYGRSDAVRIVETLDVGRIPWTEYTIKSA